MTVKVKNLYHGTSLENALMMLNPDNLFIEQSIGFYLDCILNPIAKELWELTKRMTVEEFVDIHRRDSHLCFTQSFSTAARYALQKRYPVVLALNDPALRIEESIAIYTDKLGHIIEAKIPLLDISDVYVPLDSDFSPSNLKRMQGNLDKYALNRIWNNNEILFKLTMI